MFGIFFVIIGLSFLVAIHELGHLAAAKFFKMGVEEFGIGFPPRLASRMWGGTRYSLNAIPIGGFVKLHGEVADAGEHSFVREKVWKRSVVLVAGVVVNFIAGWLIFSAVLWMGSPKVLFITSVQPNSPAASAGFKAGDALIGFKSAQEFISFVGTKKGVETPFSVMRDGKEVKITATPRVRPVAGEGVLGVGLQGAGSDPIGFFPALREGLRVAVAMCSAIFVGLSSVFVQPAAVMGPVGIAGVAASAGRMGYSYALELLGVISLNLAVLNLLPIPALDGGRLAFIFIERLRGKKFGAYAEARANGIGFTLLITLILFVTVKDIVALF